jgi:hypothetical protein
MADSNSQSPEDTNLAAIRKMSEEAFRVGPEGYSEERRQLEKEIRRGGVQKTLRRAALVSVIGIAVYFVWTRTGASHWLPGPIPRLFNWIFDIIGLLLNVVIVGLTVSIVVHKVRHPNDRSLSWGMIAIWVLFLAGCVFMVWSGRWPPNCDLSDCGGGAP